MKLYGVPGSICTTRVLVTAAEKGLDKTQLQHIPVDISAGDQKKPQYLAIQVHTEVDLYIYISLLRTCSLAPNS